MIVIPLLMSGDCQLTKPPLLAVLTQMSIESVELAVADSDQATASRTHQIAQFSKLGSVLEADSQQKLLLKFTVLDKQTKKPMRCHQAFVRLAEKETGREVVFVAEPDAQLVYRFDMVRELVLDARCA